LGLGRFLVKSWLGLVAGDYAPYKIFSLELEPAAPVFHCDPKIELRIIDETAGTVGIAAFIGGERAAICWLWFGERYRRERNFLPLQPDEAKLVHIETAHEFRGHGLAGALLSFAAWEMKRRGFVRLYARVWHNNFPSIRAFTKAGWTYQRFILELEPLRLGRRVRMSFKGTS
jgi:GNAT superfamily N-acetyltransferase